MPDVRPEPYCQQTDGSGRFCSEKAYKKAGNQTRTDDPFITSEVLYQLSYSGLFCNNKDITVFTWKSQGFPDKNPV